MTAPRPLAIVNPSAGGGRCGREARLVLDDLARRGHPHTVALTEVPGHATELAREAWDAGTRRFLVVGGDGTGFEVLNGLFPAAWPVDRPAAEGPPADRPTLATLPLGTGNSFVRDVGVVDTGTAMRALAGDHRVPADVVRVHHDGGPDTAPGVLHFANLLSIGFTARVGALTNRRFKALGPAGYAVATVASLVRHTHPVFPVALDGGPVDRRPCTFLSFSNSQFTGGTMHMAPTADLGDGRLDVIRVGPLSRTALLGAFPGIYAGRHVDRDDVEATTAATVDLTLDGPVDCMVDGEIVTIRPTRFEVLPGAIDVVGLP